MKTAGRPPYCSLALIVAALSCHFMVYFGNMYAARSIEALGHSSNGWAEIGLSLGRSIGGELDRQLTEVGKDLTDVVSRVVEMKGMIGGALSLVSLARGDSELSADAPQSYDETVLVTAFLVERVAEVVLALKPVLSQVERWQASMGENLQSKVEDFTGTIDKAQKIFDLITQYVDDTDNGEDAMLHDTFLLIDASSNGHITVDDLHAVGEMYSISAFSGSKAEELMVRYDSDRDRALNRIEYKDLVGDASLPGVMAVVLRSYASNLLRIAGSVGNARTRGEVAHAVADYLRLVCNKNMTKVAWVAGALTNGSLPLAFTADVLAQFAADPKNAETGALIVGQMANYGGDYVASAVELMANVSFWQTSGFDPEGQPSAVEQAARWATEGYESPAVPALLQIFGFSALNCSAPIIDEESELSHLLQVPAREAVMLQTSLASERVALQNGAAAGLPAMVRQFAERGAQQRAALLKAERVLHRDVALSPARAHGALKRLLGDEEFPQFLSSVFVADSDVAKVVNAGVAAKPETLQFAEWLSNNATATARMLAQQCFQYTAQSSGSLDSVASRVSGMVKRVQSATAALASLKSAAQKGQIEGAFFNLSSSLLASIEENRQLAPQLSEESLQAVASAVAAIVRIASNSSTPEAESARQMSAELQERLRSPRVSRGDSDRTSLWPSNGSVIVFDAAWDTVSPFVNALQDSIPSNVINIRVSRREVVSTSASLMTFFSVFQDSGPALFEKAATSYRRTWAIYIIIDIVLALWFAFFALWASGFFGTRGHAMHPQASAWVRVPEERPSPPTTFWEKCRVTFESISYGFLTSADNYMLFWSILLLTEGALLFFFSATMLISIFFCVRLVIATGCGELYILGSRDVCKDMLMMVSEWMSTFTHVGGEPIESACETQSLLTCDIITSSLGRALTFTLFASFFAAMLSWFVLVDSAASNETIRWQLAEFEDKKAGKQNQGDKEEKDEDGK